MPAGPGAGLSGPPAPRPPATRVFTAWHRLARSFVAASLIERHIACVTLNHTRRALRHLHSSFKLTISIYQFCSLRRGSDCVREESSAYKMPKEICLRISHGVAPPRPDALA